jgi:hypothetical protein
LTDVIGLKLSAAISGVRTIRLGADLGVRPIEKVNQDITDVHTLISVCNLCRGLPLGNPEVQRIYEIIYDGGDTLGGIS